MEKYGIADGKLISRNDVNGVAKLLVVAVSFFLVLSCGKKLPTVPIFDLLSAPERVEINGRQFVLETYLWRDFMPISPPDGKPLIALTWVTAIDSAPFPSSLNATRLWVVNGEQVWEAKFSDEPRPPTPPHQLEKIARNGPKWGPGLQVEVVVKLVYNNKDYLLRASKQPIWRTD